MIRDHRHNKSWNPFAGAWGYLQLFRKHIGRRLYLVFFLAMLAALTEGIGIALVLPLLATLDLGAGAAQSTPRALAGLLDWLGLSGSLVGILLLIGGAFLLKSAIQFGYQAYGALLQARLVRQLKAKLFDAYSRMSYSYYARNNTGHFLNVIGTQVHGFYTSFAAYKSFLTRLIQAAAYLAVALWLAWQFGVVAIAVGAGLLLLFRRLNAYVRRLSVEAAQENSRLNKLLVQSLQSFKYLASTHRIGRVRSGVIESIRLVTDHQLRKALWSSFTGVIREPLSLAFIIGLIIVQVVVLDLPLAPILIAILIFHRALGTLVTVQGHWQTMMSTVGSVEMVRDELERLADHRERDGTVVLGPLEGGIELVDVGFAYDPSVGDVLEGISLTIPARTTVALVGESGAGKSTLVDLLTLLLEPRAGEIRIDEVPSTEVKRASWRSQIGYVAQDPVVFDDTIAANIAMGEVETTDGEVLERVRTAARRAHIAQFIETLPEGYATVVGDRGIRLSGGQRQRLAIARELFKEPSLLILDEATSSLDTESERHIQASIDDLHGEMTVVIIAHRLSTIRNVDRVYVLEAGRLIEEGAYDELRDLPHSRFRVMLDLQAV